LPSPTSGSRDKTVPVEHAPAWLARFVTPFFGRWFAGELSRRYPGLGPQEIRQKLLDKFQAERGRAPSEAELRRLDAMIEGFPEESEARQAEKPMQAEKPVSAWVLVAANLVPLAGVLFWGWNAFALIALFWMENVVVGVFFILRMLTLDPRNPGLWAAKLFMVPFFCVHYGMFTAIHGVFVFGVFGGQSHALRGLGVLEPAARVAADFGLWPALAVLVASHGFSFLWNYLYRGELWRASLIGLTKQPYLRVIVLHFAIILGAVAAAALGSPLWALVVLLAVKIGLDLKAHLKEHSRPKT
jgi:hypothetical protein